MTTVSNDNGDLQLKISIYYLKRYISLFIKKKLNPSHSKQ